MNLPFRVPEAHDAVDSQRSVSSAEPRNFSEYTSRPSSGSLQRRDSHSHDASIPAIATSGDNSRRRLQATTIPIGDFSPVICASPRSSTPESSMRLHQSDLTPPESPRWPTQPSVNTGRLSRDHGEQQCGRGRGLSSTISSPSCKRAASQDLPRPPGRQSPGGKAVRSTHESGFQRPQLVCSQVRRGPFVQQSRLAGKQHCSYSNAVDFARQGVKMPRADSVYVLLPTGLGSKEMVSLNQRALPTNRPSFDRNIPQPGATNLESPMRGENRTKSSKYPGLILQPESSPISQDQLAAELKGIYAGLAMVEAKCIHVDAAQASDPTAKLGPEQWQALIALHRTLLYEHHDFLMATQHPSATPALRGLATKHSMPARMWKHGIHAFLDVLRHRRPASQEYMLSFIYLAYQMIALLYETVPAFLDTWVECLGDLARYRMAIEDERETHAQWGSVAASWYSIASDRHPTVGRLNHHLGILERPSLRKYFYYAKSLTCVTPFSNAQDSLSSLCGPIVKDEEGLKSSNQSAEFRIVTFHALLFTGHIGTQVETVARHALQLFAQLPSPKIRDIGVSLAVSNVSSLLQLGNPTNLFWALYKQSIKQSTSKTGLTQLGSASSLLQVSPTTIDTQRSSITDSIQLTFCYSCINEVLHCTYNDRYSQRDTLAYVHVMLVWLHSLVTLASQQEGQHVYLFNRVLGPSSFSWIGLAKYLNLLIQHERDQKINTGRLSEQARAGTFPAPEPATPSQDSANKTTNRSPKPLGEDYLVRGLVWTHWYFSPEWFDGTAGLDGRAIESAESCNHRVLRVLWLGLYLASHTGYLTFNKEQHFFSAPVACTNAPFAGFAAAESPTSTTTSPISVERTSSYADGPRTPTSRSSTGQSGVSEVEDGFLLVKRAKGVNVVE